MAPWKCSNFDLGTVRTVRSTTRLQGSPSSENRARAATSVVQDQDSVRRPPYGFINSIARLMSSVGLQTLEFSERHDLGLTKVDGGSPEEEEEES